jgi:class 3 adenylate cyclase/tetratricopeptide (TPR) repeat protein
VRAPAEPGGARLPRGDRLSAALPCPRCERANPADASFCAGCGAALARACAGCGRANAPDARFCNGCGQPLAGPGPATPSPDPRSYTPKHLADKILQSRSALEGERKQVTVLFADVKGSMELAGRVDPEAWHGILDGFFSILADGVHRFDGVVNQYTGDGIMALFGAPIAHEDHAQRACYAALALREELSRYAREVKRRHVLGFATRMGLHSGEVVVGKIGDDLRMDYTAQGHTVGLAQRMEALAEPNTCYLSGATASLVSGYFALDDLGAFEVKGVSGAVPVFELRGLGTARTRFDVSRARGLSRFVGREADLRTLDDALAAAQAGHGQVLGIVAEAGTGKSRLCFEFAERCRAHGLTVLEGAAVAHGKNLPLLPILQVFRAYYGIDERDDDRTVRERIAGRLLLLDESFRDVLPVMFEFFGVPDPERPVPRMEPEAKQRVLFGVLRKIVQGADPRAGAQNFVTLIEDLHWMDAASEAFLEQWVDALAGGSGLLVLNFRPEYRADWMQKSYYRQIPLAPLGPGAVAELLADLLGRDPSLAGLAAAIHARTGGNPFFTEEVAQSLVESGQLQGERGAYRLVTALEKLEVPSRVQAVLAARIDRLPEREKQLLQTAAVIGKEFSEPVLARVAELPAPELRDALAALRRAEFVYEASLYPVTEYAFKHPLTQEVALGSQLRERRARRHAAVARALEELHADKLDEQAALLAQHWDEAAEPIVAARWYERAALRIGQSDVGAAARHWRRIRELARERPEDAEAAGLATRACTWVLSAGWRLGISPEEMDATAAEARGWLARSSDPDAEVRLEAGIQSILLINRGQVELSLAAALAAERVAETAGDPHLRAMARYLSVYPWYNIGRVDRARERADELIAYAHAHGDIAAPFGGEDILALVIGLQAVLESQHGSVARARTILADAQRMARERGFVESEGWTSMFTAWIQWIDGDSERALPHCRRGLELAERIGSPFSIAWALSTLALVLAHGGSRESLEVAERSVALSRDRVTALEGEPQRLAALAEACRVTGDLARARRSAEEGVAVARRRGLHRYEFEAWLSLSRALRARGDAASLAAAREALAEVDALAETRRAPNWRWVAELERAEVAAVAGDDAARERHLRTALAGFEKIEAEYRVRQIRGLLSEPR